MKIALLGYGKMGKEIEQIALDRGHEISAKIDVNESVADNLEGSDAAIEFSTPESAYNNIMACFENNVPVVVGTTGWLDRYDEIVSLCKEKNQALFYASNFSIGVNIFFEINRRLAELMNAHEQYDPSVEEIHHIHKLDAPSGTAITIAEDIVSNLKRKEGWVPAPSTADKELQVASIRTSEVPGTHITRYYSEIDNIEIKHTANGRKGFALGAVLAAEWIHGKTGVFGMRDLMNN